ncbi:MAG: ribonuclease [Firmicutes bacterium]|nr:ribonuclease [Bacillota bacterium]
MNRTSKTRRIITILLAAVLLAAVAFCTGCGSKSQEQDTTATTAEQTTAASQTEATDDSDVTKAASEVREDGTYDSRDEVTAYLLAYGRLPDNYITKDEARQLGWEGGSLERYAPGMCIGGDRFGNYEGLLPEGEYQECDIDTLGKENRGPKRLVFSDEAIYYTDDHYGSFTKMAERK